MKRLFLNFAVKFLSKTMSNRFWERVHNTALAQLNIGIGGDFRESGEVNVLDFLATKLKNESQLILVDAGANKGNYAKGLHEVFGSRSKIFCFEPSKKTFQSLHENTHGLDTIACFNFGLSDQTKKQTFFSSTTQTGLASLYQRRIDLKGSVLTETEEVELTTLDSFCEKHSIERVHFLKMDIEGHELSALRGASRMLQEGRIDFIQFEFGSVNIDSRTYFRDFYYMLSDRYDLYRIGKKGLQPVTAYHEWMEVFLTTNYLACKKV